VDSVSHALIITIVLALAGRPDLIPYGIMGAVLIDVDVSFNFFSRRDPRLYIFTHGGFTHSFMGVAIISTCVAIISLLVSFTGLLPSFGLFALAAIVAGALSHIIVDYLAYPGIPLFYPATDKKYTLGVLGGPSAFIMAGSIVFIGLVLAGKSDLSGSWAYVAYFGAVLGFSAITKCYASLKTTGRTIATMNPFKWMVIENTKDLYRFYQYDFFKPSSAVHTFEKYIGIDHSEAERYAGLPELKRLYYHSYVVTVEKNGDGIIYRDPIREGNYIWYPPYFKHFTVHPPDK
jgi:inner membrane protein